MVIPELQKTVGSGYVRFGNGDRVMVLYWINTRYDKKRNTASATGQIEYSAPGVLGRAMIESARLLDIGHAGPPIEFTVKGCQGKTADVVFSSRVPSLAGANPSVRWNAARS